MTKHVYDLPQTYTVAYYNPETDENLTAEEWKQLNPRINPSEVKIINQGETYISWKAGVDYPIYGPGFWDDFGEGLLEAGKFGLKFGGSLLIGAGIAATGPFAIPIGAAVATEGYIIKKMGEQVDNSFVEGLGDSVMGGGFGGIADGLLGKGSSSLTSKGANSAFNAGIRTVGTNGSKVLLNSWIYTKAGQYGYELVGKGKNGLEAFCYYFHGQHRSRGVDYDSECPICNGHFDKFFWL